MTATWEITGDIDRLSPCIFEGETAAAALLAFLNEPHCDGNGNAVAMGPWSVKGQPSTYHVASGETRETFVVDFDTHVITTGDGRRIGSK